MGKPEDAYVSQLGITLVAGGCFLMLLPGLLIGMAAIGILLWKALGF